MSTNPYYCKCSLFFGITLRKVCIVHQRMSSPCAGLPTLPDAAVTCRDTNLSGSAAQLMGFACFAWSPDRTLALTCANTTTTTTSPPPPPGTTGLNSSDMAYQMQLDKEGQAASTVAAVTLGG